MSKTLLNTILKFKLLPIFLLEGIIIKVQVMLMEVKARAMEADAIVPSLLAKSMANKVTQPWHAGIEWMRISNQDQMQELMVNST